MCIVRLIADETHVTEVSYKCLNKGGFSHPANHHMPSIPFDYGIYLVKYSQVKTMCV